VPFGVLGLRECLRAACPMLVGRPHEAVSNGGPRWMAAGPRERVHRTRPTGQLARRLTCINKEFRPRGTVGNGTQLDGSVKAPFSHTPEQLTVVSGDAGGYSPVWSSTSALEAFFFTDSIPLSAECFCS